MLSITCVTINIILFFRLFFVQPRLTPLPEVLHLLAVIFFHSLAYSFPSLPSSQTILVVLLYLTSARIPHLTINTSVFPTSSSVILHFSRSLGVSSPMEMVILCAPENRISTWLSFWFHFLDVAIESYSIFQMTVETLLICFINFIIIIQVHELHGILIIIQIKVLKNCTFFLEHTRAPPHTQIRAYTYIIFKTLITHNAHY